MLFGIAKKGLLLLWGVTLIFLAAPSLMAQVSPAEIKNPHLRALEKAHLKQLIAVQRAVDRLKFPFPLALDRYVGLDPAQQVGADTRGLEFVNFHGNTVLKISGNYNAAFDTHSLTQNQRADQVFRNVVTPILRLLPDYFSPQDNFANIGFEIAYHVRRNNRNFDYEGKEILVVVMDKRDALNYSTATNTPDRQEILNRSDIYVDGKQFGLALGKAAPIDLADIESGDADSAQSSNSSDESAASMSASSAGDNQDDAPAYHHLNLRLPRTLPPRESVAAAASSSQMASPAPATSTPSAPAAPAVKPEAPPASALTEADADALEQKYQAQLGLLNKEGVAKFHFVDYAPPTFALFHQQIFLQLTLRNTNTFNAENTSIYRRAARTFDLFLAPQLKPILERLSKELKITGVDITVINDLQSASGKASEAVEYACPIQTLRHFANADITNQDLINQCYVLVNGVRIALNLQQVE